ncbi:MAG: alcohol dehydrogenase catalytic domain-containing protein [Deltaproteobacteria bacterium]|jgi:(R,R)-butanediol dehydrogenase/meso-butanediol dehydrogenase/diacetyl reductase|nr:alcohol dehydrogenase catalytic domain-containing protein [Deltaproteobacteria bacterium]MBW2499608.1 alcohol dehydrogenase catalytic domain-containing protein [Deltaproteobacteria bacterium]
MKVAVYTGPREPFRIEERAIPEPGEDELLIRVGRCGICATDVSTWTGDAGMEPGLVYGHEFAGEVVDRGTAVRDIEIGTRVTAQCVTACGECDECRRGHLVFCPEWRPHPSGGFGQFMTLPAREAYVLPPSLTLEDGALVEPLAVGLRGVRLAGIDTRSRVLVLGAGPIGLSAAFWARRRGASDVVVAATSERRRDFALEMGATDFVVLGDDAESSIRSALGGPPDIVLECAGFPGAMMQAMSWIRPKGTIVCMGYGLHPEEITTAVPLLKELRVQFSMTYDHADYEEVINTLAAGHVEPRCMVTRTIALEDLTNAIEGLLERAPQCKVMVDPWA